MGRLWIFLRHNPLPALVLLGLAGGTLARFGFDEPEIARWIWLTALIIGGAPLVAKGTGISAEAADIALLGLLHRTVSGSDGETPTRAGPTRCEVGLAADGHGVEARAARV